MPFPRTLVPSEWNRLGQNLNFAHWLHFPHWFPWYTSFSLLTNCVTDMISKSIIISSITNCFSLYWFTEKKDVLLILLLLKLIEVTKTEWYWIFFLHYTFHYFFYLFRFEIALPQNEEELLIPFRLPISHPDVSIPNCEFVLISYN